MVRVGAQETVQGLHGTCRIVILKIHIREVDLSLLRIGAERVAGLKLGIVILRQGPVAVSHGGTPFGVELIGAPVAGGIDFQILQPAAAGHADGRCCGSKKTGQTQTHRMFQVHDE